MKYRKCRNITRRDFVRITGGTLAATKMGLIGCGDSGSDPSSGSAGSAGAATAGTGGYDPGWTGPVAGTGGGSAATAGGGTGGSAATGGSGGTGKSAAGGAGGAADEGGASSGTGGAGGAAGEGGASGGTSGAGGSGGSAATSGNGGTGGSGVDDGKSRVYIVKATDRSAGLSQLLTMVDLGFASNKNVVIKPNFNSANAFPAGTHDDTIRAVVGQLKAAGCNDIVLGESSGPSGTRSVITDRSIPALCTDLGITFSDFDQLAANEWEAFSFSGMGWGGQLEIPAIMRSDHAVVLLPCCKTHAYGGHFTLSLKLAVGLTPRSRRMSEMHASSDIRSWIADINYGFTPDLVVMDALSCFITGGPDSGTLAEPGLLLAGTDRVAIDAVGVAILKTAGASTAPLQNPIFDQDQIARAVSIGLGAASPDAIELVGDDAATISELRSILDAG